jgi:MIP family channel proteins
MPREETGVNEKKETNPGNNDKEHKEDAQKEPPELGRSFFAEAFGTFCLTMVDCGAVMVGEITHKVSETALSIVPALLIMAMIYSLGHVSGAHFNPAVTIAFALRRVFSWKLVPVYIACQLCGALIAATVLHFLFGNVKNLGTSTPHYDLPVAFTVELMVSCILISVILGTATKHKTMGPEAAVAVGGTIALCGLFAKPISSASMNPARSIGPAIISASTENLWIFVSAPVAAGIAGVLIVWVLHGPAKKEEVEGARGDGE